MSNKIVCEYHVNGKLKSEKIYINSENMLIKDYDGNGNIYKETEYKNDIICGKQSYYLKEIINYYFTYDENGNKNGSSKFYFPLTYKIKFECKYENNHPIGQWNEFYFSGKLYKQFYIKSHEIGMNLREGEKLKYVIK